MSPCPDLLLASPHRVLDTPKVHCAKKSRTFAGLGARELAADGDIVPVRGQVRRVRAPWVKHAMFLDGTYYILPNIDSVVVGGTTQRGDERTEVDWDDHARIWENILHVCPSLETAETVTDWVRFTSKAYLGQHSQVALPLVHDWNTKEDVHNV